jgi:translation initiation factor 1
MTRLFAGTPFDRPPTCERCGKLEAECICLPPAREWKDPAKQTARVTVEKRPKGKVATVISGLKADDNDLAALLRDLKSACGAGGCQEGDVVELQGDHATRVETALLQRGYKVRR